MKRQRKRNTEQDSFFYSEDYGFLGHLLYSERLIQGISLERVACDLNLSSYIIKNLETGYLNRTPGLSYMQGFLRTYASYLELDSKEISTYLTIPPNTLLEEESVLKTPFQLRQLPSNSILWGSISVLVILLIGYGALRSPLSPRSRLHSIALYHPTIKPLDTKESYSDKLEKSINQFLSIYYKPFAKTPS